MTENCEQFYLVVKVLLRHSNVFLSEQGGGENLVISFLFPLE